MAATAQEQLMLEYINDARLDPLGDAARYIASYAPLHSHDADINFALSARGFDVDGALLHRQFEALKAVQPVAWNSDLAASADAHTRLMIHDDEQSHQLSGEPDPFVRMTEAGYHWTVAGENIFAFADSELYAQAAFMVDWGGSPSTGGMQSPPDHRINIMDGDFREVGVGVAAAKPAGPGDVGPLVMTEDFGSRGSNGTLLLGVDYRDADHDHFYSVGEGVKGLVVKIGSAHAISPAAGGYTLATSLTGTHLVSLSHGGLTSAAHVAMTFKSGLDAKLDVIDGHTVHVSTSATVSGGGVTTLAGLGIHGLHLTTGVGHQAIVGTSGNDVLDGGAGIDTLTGGAGHDTFVFDSALGSSNIDRLSGFSVSQDRIELDHAIFTELGSHGALNPAFFHSGTQAADGSDHIIYSSHTGSLFYDPDGTGAAHQVHFATLAPGLALHAADFLVG
jgi:hypothetical protein